MMVAKIQKLIDEVLILRRMGRVTPDSCFVFNQAGQELRELGKSALRQIEMVIRGRIALVAAGLEDPDSLIEKYPGILDLWRTYYHIAEGEDICRAVTFLSSLQGPLLGCAVLAMRTAWPQGKHGRRIPSPVLDFLEHNFTKLFGPSRKAAQQLVLEAGHHV